MGCINIFIYEFASNPSRLINIEIRSIQPNTIYVCVWRIRITDPTMRLLDIGIDVVYDWALGSVLCCRRLLCVSPFDKANTHTTPIHWQTNVSANDLVAYICVSVNVELVHFGICWRTSV